jgi:hypothetical protein
MCSNLNSSCSLSSHLRLKITGKMRFTPGLRFAIPIVALAAGYLAGRGLFAVPVAARTKEKPHPPSPAAAVAKADSAELRDEPFSDRARVAFQPNDGLGNARRLSGLLKELTAADFADLDQVMKNFHAVGKTADDEVLAAYRSEFARRWWELSPDGVVKAIPTIASRVEEVQGDKATALLMALARVEPAKVFDALPPPTPMAGWSYRVRVRAEIFRTIAETDLSAARRLLSRCTSPKEQKQMMEAIAMGVATNDPIAAARMAGQLKSDSVTRAALASAAKIGAGKVLEVMAFSHHHYSELDLSGLVIAHPNAGWELLDPGDYGGHRGVTSSVFAEARWLTSEQRLKLLERSAQFPPELRKGIQWICLDAWFAESPREAAEWSIAHVDTSTDGGKTEFAFKNWVEAEPQAARSWLAAQTPSRLTEQLAERADPQKEWDVTRERLAAIAAGPKPKVGEDLKWYTYEGAKAAPMETATWLMELPESVDAGPALSSAVHGWAIHDPGAALAWFESIPPGPRQQAALRGMAEGMGFDRPAAGAALALQIEDPAARQESVQKVYEKWISTDPASARAWLETVPEVDPRWKKWILRAF